MEKARMSSRSCHRFRGFTLIELLVVISIIAMLVALLMPVLSKAREAARSAQCLVHLRQIGIATANYQTEFRGYFPSVFVSGNAANPAPGGNRNWAVELRPYISTPTAPVGTLTPWRCPTLHATHASVGRDNSSVDYSWNGYLGNTSLPISTGRDHRFRDVDIYRHSQTVVASDGLTTSAATPPVIKNQNNSAWYLRREMNDPDNNSVIDRVRGYYHFNPNWAENAGSLNALFVDGHAKTYQHGTLKAGWFKVRDAWRDQHHIATSQDPLKW